MFLHNLGTAEFSVATGSRPSCKESLGKVSKATVDDSCRHCIWPTFPNRAPIPERIHGRAPYCSPVETEPRTTFRSSFRCSRRHLLMLPYLPSNSTPRQQWTYASAPVHGRESHCVTCSFRCISTALQRQHSRRHQLLAVAPSDIEPDTQKKSTYVLPFFHGRTSHSTGVKLKHF